MLNICEFYYIFLQDCVFFPNFSCNEIYKHFASIFYYYLTGWMHSLQMKRLKSALGYSRRGHVLQLSHVALWPHSIVEKRLTSNSFKIVHTVLAQLTVHLCICIFFLDILYILYGCLYLCWLFKRVSQGIRQLFFFSKVIYHASIYFKITILTSCYLNIFPKMLFSLDEKFLIENTALLRYYK